MSTLGICSIGDCSDPVSARGLCNRHYHRFRRHGDPRTVLKARGEGRRFLQSVLDGSAEREPNGCILWPAMVDEDGYPYFREQGRRVRATHLVLEHFHGPRPSPRHTAGHALHEVCGRRHCIAPEHLSWQTPAEQRRNQMLDGSAHLPVITGEAHPKALLSDDEVIGLICQVLGGRPMREVAREAGVGRTTVRHWMAGKNRPELLAKARQALAASLERGKPQPSEVTS